MAYDYKLLGQVLPAATTLTAAYTVPSATKAVVSSIFICNNSGSDTTFSISIAIAGAADSTKQYLYKDMELQANDTFVFTTGLTLGAGDIVRVYTPSSSVSVNVFGQEIS